jgi:hypothetical protein
LPSPPPCLPSRTSSPDSLLPHLIYRQDTETPTSKPTPCATWNNHLAPTSHPGSFLFPAACTPRNQADNQGRRRPVVQRSRPARCHRKDFARRLPLPCHSIEPQSTQFPCFATSAPHSSWNKPQQSMRQPAFGDGCILSMKNPLDLAFVSWWGRPPESDFTESCLWPSTRLLLDPPGCVRGRPSLAWTYEQDTLPTSHTRPESARPVVDPRRSLHSRWSRRLTFRGTQKKSSLLATSAEIPLEQSYRRSLKLRPLVPDRSALEGAKS